MHNITFSRHKFKFEVGSYIERKEEKKKERKKKKERREGRKGVKLILIIYFLYPADRKYLDFNMKSI